MRLVAAGLVVLALALAPARARADVVPRGWSAPAAPEETHVAMLRASIAAWATPSERALLDARRHPRCAPEETPRARRGGALYTRRRCPDLDSIRRVAIDRAVRFFAAEILDAEGRASDAAALRAAPPMHDAAALAAVSPRLTAASTAAARELAEHGTTSSLEQVAAALGRLLEAALRAGVPRDRLVQAAVEMLAELARPTSRVTARLEQDGGELPGTIARRAQTCLEPHFEARWQPVAVRIVVVRGAAGVAVRSTGPREVRECVERAARRALERTRMPPGVRSARIVVGPPGVLWGAPVQL